MAAVVMPTSDVTEVVKPVPQQFKLWQPGMLDAVRHFLLSERFQSATQLAAGVLFVSLFVFVDALRFPGSCVAILLYFVVAVTAAPDCHVGTRIFLCGFMIGPMWLSLLLGGTIASLGKLAPTREGELIILCVLGPLVLIPFAINRIGTRHLYLFAMGMVSCLYVGMPILAGWGAPSIRILWERAVGFVLVAALIGMFAGSVLSIIVLPSLASHKLEDEISTALRCLGQHLSNRASLLWRPGKTSLHALPRHLEGLHPLLLHTTRTAQPGEFAPGLLDRDLGAATVSPRQIYVAAMDWFEHLSRPPSDPAAGAKAACLTGCRSTSTSESAHSERVKSTFYGPKASAMAAAVVAAAQDSEEEQQWQQQLQDQNDQVSALRNWSWVGNKPINTSSSARNSFAWRQHGMPAAGSFAAAAHDPLQLRLGSTVTAATVKDAKAEVLQFAESVSAAQGRPVLSGGYLYSGPSSRALGREQPCPSISAVRQLLAHANQLLEAAGAEPQWLRAGERRYQPAPWTKMVAASQLVALRMRALDIIQQDFVSLSEETHSFPVAEELSQLLQQLYGSAAAALAMIAEQVRCREQLTAGCAANQNILKHPSWRAGRQQMLHLLEGTLAHYFVSIQQASAEQPVTLPSAHWVRRWMFFHTTTLSLLDALDGLADAAEAALTTPPQQQTTSWWQCWRSSSNTTSSSSSSRPQPTSSQKQQQVGEGPGHTGADLEAGVKLSSPQQQQQQQQPQELELQPHSVLSSSGNANSLDGKPSSAVLGSLVSMRLGSQDAAAAADAAVSANSPQQQQAHGTPPVTSAEGSAAQTEGVARSQQPTAAAAAAGQAGQQVGGVTASCMKHTAWIRPWLPLALNLEQYHNLRIVFTEDIPKALSSKKAFVAALRNRRVHAAIKYWCVLVMMMVGTLLLQYFVPVSTRFSPSFGYTAAVVGMSDRVESTVFKIFLWTGATVVGATLGWALMSHPSMALNSVALGAVMCTVAFCVGTLERGPGKGSSLFTLFTVTTLASIVLCQCCGSVGSTWLSLTRGASVIVAAVVSLAVQNMILPWYTSTWALEQLGLVYMEATEVLADLVCQLYEDTERLLQQQQLLHVAASDPAASAAAGGGGGGSSHAATDADAAGDAGEGGIGDSSSGKGAQQSPLHRLQLLDDAVKRVWEREQQQQQSTGGSGYTTPSQQQQQMQGQQQGQQGLRQASFTATVAAARLASMGRMFTASSQLEHLLQPSTTGVSVWGATVRQGVAASAASTSAGEDAAAAAAAVKAALADDGAARGEAAVCEMVQLLRQRRQKYRQQNQQQQEGGVAAGAGRVAVTGLQLQARLVRPLVQVKISLVLDTTAWKSGPLATPQLVLRMHAAMFELVDALAALQQAVSMPVTKLNGSWDWTLMHTAGALGALLLQAMQLAEATAAHVLGPTADTTQTLLAQIQEVQHKRFEYFAVQRELRRLLHTALATDKELAESHLSGINEWQLQGHLRYSACVYATGKVLDRVTAAARCALSACK